MRNCALAWAAALLLVATGASATVFLQEGFESDALGWEVVGQINNEPGVLWHRETHRPHTGTWSMAYNTGAPDYNYDVGTSWGLLASPWIDLSSASSVQLTFSSWLETENDPYEYDVAFFMLKDDGLPWVELAPDIQTRPQGQWNDLAYDLSSVAGAPEVRIGFYFSTMDDIGNDFEGWYIDDVLLTDGETPPVPEPSTLLLLGTGLLGAGAVLRMRRRA